MNYNYFRDYEPGSGRYVKSDPIGLNGGASTYSYVSGAPLLKVDHFGLLEHFVFYLNSKDMSSIECGCGDKYDAFSGSGSAKNNPNESQDVDDGPIPPGRYYIVNRPSGGRLGFVDTWKGKDEWFALYADDGSPNDYTATGIHLRGQFRLHPGTISKGCVTLPSKTDFEAIRERLMHTKQEYIPGTKVLYYGTITVK